MINILLGEDKLDFERLVVPAFDQETAFETVKSELRKNLSDLLAFLQKCYNLVTLSIETNYHSIYEASSKRMEYVNFLEKEYVEFFSKTVAAVSLENESREILKLNTQFDYLFQIYDSIDDIFNTKKAMNKHYIELKSDLLLMVRELSNHTLAMFEDIHNSMVEERPLDSTARAKELQELLDKINRDLLPLLAQPDRRDAGALSNFVTYSRRLKDKLVNFTALQDSERISQ